MSINTEKLAEIYFILEKLERPDLMDFIQERVGDPDYNEDTATSDEDDDMDESELVSEEITVSKTQVEGQLPFYKIVDTKLSTNAKHRPFSCNGK